MHALQAGWWESERGGGRLPSWPRRRVHVVMRDMQNPGSVPSFSPVFRMARNEDLLAETLRRVIREEVAPYIATPKRRSGKRQ